MIGLAHRSPACSWIHSRQMDENALLRPRRERQALLTIARSIETDVDSGGGSGGPEGHGTRPALHCFRLSEGKTGIGIQVSIRRVERAYLA